MRFMLTRTHLAAAVAAVAVVAALVAAIITLVNDRRRGAFEPGTAKYPLPCMKHQSTLPEAPSDTQAVLIMLKYYTANGNRPYCDKAGPGDADRAWAALYVKAGADPAKVQGILGH